MSHYIPVNTGGAPVNKGGRTLAGGVALVATGLGLFYVNMNRRQVNQEANDTVQPGSWPTWQFRLRQAANIASTPLHAGTMTLKASRIEPRFSPLSGPQKEHNNGHSVIPKFDETHPRIAHAITQPAPQRDRGDGRPYTKSPDNHDYGMRRGREHVSNGGHIH